MRDMASRSNLSKSAEETGALTFCSSPRLGVRDFEGTSSPRFGVPIDREKVSFNNNFPFKYFNFSNISQNDFKQNFHLSFSLSNENLMMNDEESHQKKKIRKKKRMNFSCDSKLERNSFRFESESELQTVHLLAFSLLFL